MKPADRRRDLIVITLANLASFLLGELGYHLHWF
jgi:hypothetical protein